MPKVDSSMIYRLDYEKSTKELDITFTSGKTYTYFDVPPQVYRDFLNAGSKGRFFLDSIKDQYPEVPVRGRRRA